MTNLETEPDGARSLLQFARQYPDLRIVSYAPSDREAGIVAETLRRFDLVIVHEWNSPELVHRLLELRELCGYRMLFHDTHHRASSSPASIRLLALDRFDGVLAFGEALSSIYRDRFHLPRVWTLHEAADTDVFYPREVLAKRHDPEKDDLVWIGNWGDNERSREIDEFLLRPAANLPGRRFAIYGVRYPENGLNALRDAGVAYRGYLPNLDAPDVYAAARCTVHIPRQQYVTAMQGIPTIRVFEALACGIPLLSAPWADSEGLFRPGDFRLVNNAEKMRNAICALLSDPKAAQASTRQGLETVRQRHTCRHRAEQLTEYCEELFR